VSSPCFLFFKVDAKLSSSGGKEGQPWKENNFNFKEFFLLK
jgi:hypothetical protein